MATTRPGQIVAHAIAGAAGLITAGLVGCQGGTSSPPPPSPPPSAPTAPRTGSAGSTAGPAGNTAGTAGSAAGTADRAAATAGSAAAPAGSAAAPADRAASPAAVPAHVQLPRSPEAPLSYATRPIDRNALARLAAIEFPDFERQGSHATEAGARVRHVTRTRPILGATVEITRCAKPCPAISTARWVARRDEVSELALPATLVRRPDTRFELGGVTVAGVPALYSYALGSTGASGTTGAEGQPSETYVDSYTLDYRDGVNQFHVAASYLDDAVGGVDRLLAIAPPEDLQKLATAFLSFYLHECQ